MGLGAIGLIGTAASTGLSMWGGYQQAQAQEAAAQYNYKVAKQTVANRERETTEAIRRKRRNNRAQLSSMNARMAKSGVRLDTGTPLDLMADAAGRLELEIDDAARSAHIQNESILAQGKMGVWEAKQSANASNLAAVGTGLSGGIRIWDMYQQGSYTGIY